jgi:hypothetical protein
MPSKPILIGSYQMQDKASSRISDLLPSHLN